MSIYPLDPTGVVPGRDVTEEGVADPDNTIPEVVADHDRTDAGFCAGSPKPLAGTPSSTPTTSRTHFPESCGTTVRTTSLASPAMHLGLTGDSTRCDSRETSRSRGAVAWRVSGAAAPEDADHHARLHDSRRRLPRRCRVPSASQAFPIRLFAAPYKGSDQQAQVAIAAEFGVEALSLAERQGRLVGDLVMALRPTSAEGKLLAGQRHELSLALKPETYESAKTRGIRLVTEISLPPGRYQLRVAGGPSVGRAGSVTYDLEIPNYAKEPLTMSGVALTSSTAKETVTVCPGTGQTSRHQTAVAPYRRARILVRRDRHAVYRGVQERQARAAYDRLQGRPPFGCRRPGDYVYRTTPIGPAKRNRRRLWLHRAHRLANVRPGAYFLHVEAKSSAASKATLTKDIPIRVGKRPHLSA